MPITLNEELRELETETFEIEEVADGEEMLAATSSSCSTSSCCSCSTSSCCSTSTSTSSCG
ncbi:thiazolylpeptide-type bacteriocin [Micromonospora sp. DT229]|uniref:thiazolylpeptide-type bacteriocin n=1 Tax=Micromonospora sp. DT229 TaxID=3393430 RepID=UPI003CEB5313